MPKRAAKHEKAKQSSPSGRPTTRQGKSVSPDAEPSVKLKSMGSEVLTSAFDSFSDGDRLPFAVFHYRGEYHTIKVKSDRGVIDAGLVEHLRNLLVETCPSANMYAVVYDAFVTTDGIKNDAIIMECGEARNGGVSFLVAQRYRSNSKSNVLETIGEPEVVGTAMSILR